MNRRQKNKQSKVKNVNVDPVYQATMDFFDSIHIEAADVNGKAVIIRTNPNIENPPEIVTKSLNNIKSKIMEMGGQIIVVDRNFVELNVEAIDNIIDGLTKLKEQKVAEFKEDIDNAKEKLNETS